MKVYMSIDLDDFGFYEVEGICNDDAGMELEQLYEELYNKVYNDLHLGCTIRKTAVEGWPAIYVEDADTQMARKVVIKKLEA